MSSFIKLWLWGALWLIIWPVVAAYRYLRNKPRIDNCFTWAVRRWQDEPESYLVIRWCRSSKTQLKWPHFLWLPAETTAEVKHFLPMKDDQGKRYVPDLFFEGKVVTGDCKKEMEN